MEIIEQIYESNLFYLSIVIFSVILLLGIIIGTINGWKTALYFAIWHWVGSIILVFGGQALFQEIFRQIIKLFNPNESLEITLMENQSLIIDILLILFIIAGLLVIDLIAFLIYLFFRKKMKRSITENKQIRVSNVKTRILGGSIGLISALPMAGSVAGLTTSFSKNEKVGHVFSTITKYTTFNQVKDIYDDLRSVMTLGLTGNMIYQLYDALSDFKNFDPDKLERPSKLQRDKNLEILSYLLYYNGSAKLLNDLVKNSLEGLPNPDVILDQATIDEIAKLFDELIGSLTLDLNQQENLADILIQFFPDQEEEIGKLVEEIATRFADLT